MMSWANSKSYKEKLLQRKVFSSRIFRARRGDVNGGSGTELSVMAIDWCDALNNSLTLESINVELTATVAFVNLGQNNRVTMLSA